MNGANQFSLSIGVSEDAMRRLHRANRWNCGSIVLAAVIVILAAGAASPDEDAPAAKVLRREIVSIKADLHALKGRVSEVAGDTLQTRDEVDAIREELAALTARLGSAVGASAPPPPRSVGRIDAL